MVKPDSDRENQVSEPIALVDLDGTAADFDGEMTRHMRLLQAPGEAPYVNPGNIKESPHIEARRLLIKSQPGFWRNLPKLTLGFDIIEEIRALEFIKFVLSKPPREPKAAWTEKAEWCALHLPDFSIMLTQDKGLHYGKVLADDWPPFITRWLQWRPRGQVIMPAQPWNADFQHPNVFRYTGTAESRAILREKLARIRETTR